MTGLSIHGHVFSIDLEHGGGMRRDIVRKALTYMGVSRAEFFAWLAGTEPTPE